MSNQTVRAVFLALGKNADCRPVAAFTADIDADLGAPLPDWVHDRLIEYGGRFTMQIQMDLELSELKIPEDLLDEAGNVTHVPGDLM